MNPIVSIITPTYNHEKYIGECIESVINQTFEKWEMIIIDDGSTDNTGKVVSSYDDDRIIYIKQENQGPYKLGITYNKALKLSKGEYIAILEGDDFWPPRKLEYQLPSFNDDSVIMSHGRAKFVYDINGQRNIKSINIREITAIINNEPVGMALYSLLEIIGSSPVAVTTMFRKKALKEIGGFKQPEGIPLVDHPTNLELSLKGNFKYIKHNLGYFRRHKESIGHKIRKKEIKTSSDEYKSHFVKKIDQQYFNNEKCLQSILTSDINKKNEEDVPRLIIHGKELYELGLHENSNKIFKNILKGNLICQVTLKDKFLALIGLISILSRLDILGFIIKIYSLIETIYWNLKLSNRKFVRK